MITPVTPLLEAQTLECSQFINPFSLRVLATQLRNFGISILSSSPPFNHHGRSSQMCYLVSVVGGLLNEEPNAKLRLLPCWTRYPKRGLEGFCGYMEMTQKEISEGFPIIGHQSVFIEL
ncbi:uncharacterized protein [Spinacia oleracea]|uniref:Uncharacterized protein isoform X1 n=1 Tax=Spinacia oleracea TaxID=3562 RepID=A0ABM3QL00_SPIOL|nr:uncharacterized protein LOC110775651 isoform X1 [Spinacia oleracea]